jgi:NTP pyrophosphatase (non-canonical NTP hydrolase)
VNLKNLQTKLRDFAAERDWQPFHTPKNLAMALIVEAAELAEIFQWLTPEQSQAAHIDPDMHLSISDEIADVMLYLLQIADHTSVDLEIAVTQKLGKNAQKHPALRQNPPPLEAVVSAPQTHVLVDWENVQPKDSDIRALVPEVSDVWLFHGPNQKKVDTHQKSFGERATLVPIARTGKNALDFHLSFYMGYIASKRPEARFVVISNDKGYGPMLDHMIDLGFVAKQVGFDNGKKAVPKGQVNPSVETPVTPVTPKKVAAKKAAAKKTPAVQPKPKTDAPAAKAAIPKKGPAAKISAPAVTKETPFKAVTAAKKVVPAKKSGATAKAVPVRTSAPAKKVAKPAAPKPASVTEALKSTDPGPGTVKDLNKAVQRVQTSLKKTTARPARKSKLLASIKSLLGAPEDGQMIEDVLGRLLASGKVLIDDKGAVKYEI